MKKELIFTSIISITISVLIMGTCMYVFSWSEPTSMPSSYEPPINTGTTAQTKNGEIGATILTDPDNINYYVNPSGTTTINQLDAQNIQADNNVCLDSGVCLSQISEYIDNQLLVYGAHTFVDCTNAGGTLVDDTESSMKFCHFTGSACPSTWIHYKNWTTTTSVTCGSGWYNDTTPVSCGDCTTEAQPTLENCAPDICSYSGTTYRGYAGEPVACGWSHPSLYFCAGSCNCVSPITSLGCY